ncbi:unnamed protein product, partial [Adineta steineri]
VAMSPSATTMISTQLPTQQTSSSNPSMAVTSTQSSITSSSSTSQTVWSSTSGPNTTVISSSSFVSTNSVQSTAYTTQIGVTSQYAQNITSQSVTTVTAVTILRDSYIDFTLNGTFNLNPNETANGWANDLLQVFLQCFPAASAQQIQITFPGGRTIAAAAIRLFNTPSLSAQTLYQSLSSQLSDSTSQFRQNSLTSQLTSGSIVNTKTYYYCANNVTQDT